MFSSGIQLFFIGDHYVCNFGCQSKPGCGYRVNVDIKNKTFPVADLVGDELQDMNRLQPALRLAVLVISLARKTTRENISFNNSSIPSIVCDITNEETSNNKSNQIK